MNDLSQATASTRLPNLWLFIPNFPVKWPVRHSWKGVKHSGHTGDKRKLTPTPPHQLSRHVSLFHSGTTGWFFRDNLSTWDKLLRLLTRVFPHRFFLPTGSQPRNCLTSYSGAGWWPQRRKDHGSDVLVGCRLCLQEKSEMWDGLAWCTTPDPQSRWNPSLVKNAAPGMPARKSGGGVQMFKHYLSLRDVDSACSAREEKASLPPTGFKDGPVAIHKWSIFLCFLNLIALSEQQIIFNWHCLFFPLSH